MAVRNYLFPSRASMTAVAANLVAGNALQNPIFQYLFPIRYREQNKIRWYVDQNLRGVMKLRGTGGAPTPINLPGRDVFETEPGVFGEYATIGETELMELGRGVPKSDMAITLSVEQRVQEFQNFLGVRQSNRMRQMAWTLARTGALAIPLESGGIGYSEAYTVQSRTVGTLWSNKDDSTPLADLQSQQQLYGVGSDTNYGLNSVALMNTYTWNLLSQNRNENDWGGKKGIGGGSVQGMGAYDLLRADMMLPRFVIWDGGYERESDGAYQLDIPNGEIIQVGQRGDGSTPGEFSVTYNAVSESSQPYALVKDYTKGDGSRVEVPPRLEVHQGFNGGIACHRPTQYTRLIVATP